MPFIDDENNVPGDTPSKLSVDANGKLACTAFLISMAYQQLIINFA